MQYLSLPWSFEPKHKHFAEISETQPAFYNFYYMENWSTMKRITIGSQGDVFGNTVCYDGRLAASSPPPHPAPHKSIGP